MKASRKDRLAFYLERFVILRPLLLKFDGYGPNGGRWYVNRINGHVVMGSEL